LQPVSPGLWGGPPAHRGRAKTPMKKRGLKHILNWYTHLTKIGAAVLGQGSYRDGRPLRSWDETICDGNPDFELGYG